MISLAASQASKWVNCPPSRHLELKYPKRTSSHAYEGLLAHDLADAYLNYSSGALTQEEYDSRLEKMKARRGFSVRMQSYAVQYGDFVLDEFYRQGTASILSVEQQLDYSGYLGFKGRGRGDAIIASPGQLFVADFKYGKGVRVQAENNEQMMLYALAAYRAFNLMFDIHTVSMAVVQPRMHNNSVWRTDVRTLLDWAEHTAKPSAEKAIMGDGELNPGSWCQFCEAKPRCKALKELATKEAQLIFSSPKELALADLVDAYKNSENYSLWISSVKKYLMGLAMSGQKIPGLKLVSSGGRQAWSNEDTVMEVLSSKGLAPEKYTKVTLKGIGDISDLFSVDEFQRELEQYITKKPGLPSLVDDSDPREEFRPAAEVFKNPS